MARKQLKPKPPSTIPPELSDSIPPPANTQRMRAFEKAAKRFSHWRPALEELTRVRSVPTQFVQFDRATRVGGYPIERICVVHGPSNMGKALAVDTPVATPRGWVPIGKLVIGDVVTAGDGTSTIVEGVYPQGEVPLYRVEFSDGTWIRCCAEHLWRTTTKRELTRGRYVKGPRPARRNIKTGVLGEGSIKTTAQLLEGFVPRDHRIPMVGPVVFEPLGVLGVDPYLLGLMLGDGSFRSFTPRFSKPESDLIKKVIQLSAAMGDVGEQKTGMDVSIRGGVLTGWLRKYELMGLHSWSKFIPKPYMRASVPARLELLRGLLDTDGSVVAEGTSVEYSTSSFQLGEQVAELARSLGCYVSHSERTPHYTYKGCCKEGRTSQRLLIHPADWMVTGGVPLVASEKNLSKWKSPRRTIYKTIESIIPDGIGEAICIRVAHRTRLFACKDYIVTHNTEWSLGLIASFLKLDHYAALVDAEMTTPGDWVENTMGRLAHHPAFLAKRPDNYEETVNAVREFCHVINELRTEGTLDGETSGLVVVDSLRKLIPANLLATVMKIDKGDDADMLTKRTGQIKAQMNQAWIDELTPMLNRTGTGLLIIAREFDREGASADDRKYDNAWAVAGGRGVIFDSSLVVRITRASWVYESKGEDDKKVVGERIKMRIWKTKVGGKEGRFTDCYFHTSNGTLEGVPCGFDRARDVLELAEHYGIVDAKGAWYSYRDERIGQGKSNAIRAMYRQPDLLVSMEGEVRAAFSPDEVLEGGEEE